MDIFLHMIFNFLVSFFALKKFREKMMVVFGGIINDFAWIFSYINRYLLGGGTQFLEFLAYFFHSAFGIYVYLIIFFIIHYKIYNKEPPMGILLVYAGSFLHLFVDCFTHDYRRYPVYPYYPISVPLNINKYWYFGIYGEASIGFLSLLLLFSCYLLLVYGYKRSETNEKHNIYIYFVIIIAILGFISTLTLLYYYDYSIPIPDYDIFS